MTICDKIQNVGDTLETNLNNRGVSCTFGTGSGEKNILEMVNLITSSNLKGSSDAMINIAASRPYLLSGEKTDIIVTLKDGLGNPLANKSVTVSDGTSSYSGITNNQGIFTVYDISVSSNTTFTATYGTISDSCLVEYCVWVDYGVATEHIDQYYYNSNNGSVTVTDTGTKVQNSSGNFDLYFIPLDQTVSSSNIYKWNAPLVIEFDVVENNASSGQALFSIYSNTTNQSFLDNIDSTEIGHWKFVLNTDNTQACYFNGVQQKTGTATLTNARIGFRVTNQKYLIYKNFRIK